MNLTFDIVEQDVFEEDDWIVRSDCRLQQCLGIGNGGTRNKLNTRDALEVALKALTVLCSKLPSHTTGASDHKRHLHRGTWAAIGHMWVQRSMQGAIRLSEPLSWSRIKTDIIAISSNLAST